jgi:hypothetical protein
MEKLGLLSLRLRTMVFGLKRRVDRKMPDVSEEHRLRLKGRRILKIIKN